MSFCTHKSQCSCFDLRFWWVQIIFESNNLIQIDYRQARVCEVRPAPRICISTPESQGGNANDGKLNVLTLRVTLYRGVWILNIGKDFSEVWQKHSRISRLEGTFWWPLICIWKLIGNRWLMNSVRLEVIRMIHRRPNRITLQNHRALFNSYLSSWMFQLSDHWIVSTEYQLIFT